MGNRYLDWFRQAEADLIHARNALADGDYEWIRLTHWRWKKPENKGCAGLRSNPAHPLFSVYFSFICVSPVELFCIPTSSRESHKIALSEAANGSLGSYPDSSLGKPAP